MDHIKIVLDKLDKLNVLCNRYKIYDKKKKAMGLDKEEEIIHKSLFSQYNKYYNEILGDLFNHLMQNILPIDTLMNLAKIKNILVSWKGNVISSEDEFNDILLDVIRLSDEELVDLQDTIEDFYEDLVDCLEGFINTDEGVMYCEEVSKLILRSDKLSKNPIGITVSSITNMFIELAELVGLELFSINTDLFDDGGEED